MNGERRSVESPQMSDERLFAIPLPVAERQGYHQLTTTPYGGVQIRQRLQFIEHLLGGRFQSVTLLQFTLLSVPFRDICGPNSSPTHFSRHPSRIVGALP